MNTLRIIESIAHVIMVDLSRNTNCPWKQISEVLLLGMKVVDVVTILKLIESWLIYRVRRNFELNECDENALEEDSETHAARRLQLNHHYSLHGSRAFFMDGTAISLEDGAL